MMQVWTWVAWGMFLNHPRILFRLAKFKIVHEKVTFSKPNSQLSLVAHICNPTTWKAKTWKIIVSLRLA